MLGPNIGPLLLSICCLTSCATSLLTTRMVERFGYITLLAAHYATLCAFLLFHLYPVIWVLLIAYILLGVTLGPAWICKWHLVVFFANRITCGQHECPAAAATHANDPTYCNREERIRRLARWFHAVQDIGIVMGALIASVLITCNANDADCFNARLFNTNALGGNGNGTAFTTTDTLNGNVNNNSATANAGPPMTQLTLDDAKRSIVDRLHDAANAVSRTLNFYELYQNALLRDEMANSMFDTNERGARICGSDACPAWRFETVDVNGTEILSWMENTDAISLTMVYLVLGIGAMVLSCVSQQVDNTLRFEHKKSVKDTLLLAGPMAYFIGTEQGYVLGDFTRVSYAN